MKFINKDNYHISLRPIRGYGKPFNFIYSCREAGKSTALALELIIPAYENNKVAILLRRQIADITESYIDSIGVTINKFLSKEDKIKFTYKKGSVKEGVVKCFINDKFALAIVGCSNPVGRIKSLNFGAIHSISFDEYIINPEFKEKYLPNEANKIKEIYNTFQREGERVPFFFFGNPYSLYNPVFLWWGVDISKLKIGSFYVGSNFVIQCYDITPELREHILKNNPIYEFDDSYRKYGFEGRAINDSNIKLMNRPKSYSLRFVFKMSDNFIEVYQSNFDVYQDDLYYCEIVKNSDYNRSSICFDFADMVDNSMMLASSEKSFFNRFKIAMRRGNVAFKDINAYYIIKEIYYNL